MKLFEILHNDDNKCTMNKTIVSSHNCTWYADHNFVTWDFHYLFELWGARRGEIEYQLVKKFIYSGSDLEMTYDDATIIAETFLKEQLDSLGDEP